MIQREREREREGGSVFLEEFLSLATVYSDCNYIDAYLSSFPLFRVFCQK
jgi:hypothetical protein